LVAAGANVGAVGVPILELKLNGPPENRGLKVVLLG
jgi:hypothetical protein